MRRIFPLILGFTALCSLALATLPWWLSFVLPAFVSSHGVTFTRYERLGYTRFALENVAVHPPGTSVSVTLARIEADTPLLWLWRKTFSQPGLVDVGSWQVETSPSSAPLPATAGGWLPLRSQLRSTLATLSPWLPRAQLGAGTVRWPGGELNVAAVTWQDAVLKLKDFRSGPVLASAELTLFPQGQDLIQLTAALNSAPLRATLESRAADLAGQLIFQDQPALLTASFAPTGWLPSAATLRADAWSLPGARLPRGEAYARIHGATRLEWRDGQLTADFSANGEPAPGRSAPPLAAQLHARSDGAALRIETLHLTLPGLRADLSQPVVIDRTGKLLSGDSNFTFTADLAAWPQLTAQGTLTGEAHVTPDNAQFPRVAFQLAAKALAYRDWKLSALTAAGQLDWPRLQLTAVSIESANGDRLTGAGGWDFSTQTLADAQLTGNVARATLAPWLPASLDFATLALKLRATGPLATLAHTGEAQLTAFVAPPLKPLALTVQWQGQGSLVEKFTATASAGTTSLTTAGAIDAEKLTLTALALTAPATAPLQLSSPATLRWQPSLQLAGLNLTSANAALTASFTLGDTGQFNVTVKNFSSGALADLIVLPGPAWSITTLSAQSSWDRGPLTFTTTAEAAVALSPSQSAQLTLAAQGDARGIQLTALSVREGTETALRATGRLPVLLQPTGPARFTILPDAALALTATTEPTARFWTQLQALTGIDIVAPQLTAQLDGTWSKPRGTATLRATRLALDPARFDLSLPAVETVAIDLSGDTGGVVLDHFSASLDGQAVRASGRLPLGTGAWAKLQETPLALLTQSAELHLEIPDADMAALSRHLPEYLAPQGRLALDLTLKPGGDFNGTLRLLDAATRPIGVLGALQDINADLLVAGRTLTLREITARAGGQPVTLAGTIEIPAKGEPRLDLALNGTNLPLVRQLGLLLRGDLDLRLTTPASGQTQLGGTVRLHDSLFLADVRDLLPSGERGSSARAPYFSVEAAPFNRWRLDVAIDGDRFLRLRTALFTGIASAHFRLSGTLGAPIAIGEAVVNEGNVLLPFAAFAVQQSSLRLTAENPHDLQLWLTGATRRYGYDLRLELSGTLSAPMLTFSSNPALESKQVLLLVMAGQLPTNSGVITDRQRATRLGAYLGQSLLGSLGGETSSGDRLTISTGDSISRQGRETFAMEYRLDERWSLVGEYDEFDDYNAGVKWRIFANERGAFHEKP